MVTSRTPMPDGSILSFGMHLQPQPRMVSIVRRFVEESFEKLVGSPFAVHRVSLAVHELLENAAKYATSSNTELAVRCDLDGAAATIRVTNQAAPAHIDRLRTCVADIQAAPEPFAHYQNLMRRTVTLEDESGLGLARIRAEGELHLDLQIEGNVVTIVASG
jgi:anti-sigma regulatory factor (Ser/Thr protein kinase)